MNAPRVSVIMPVFNAEPFLREAIESVLAQTVEDLELIVVDDASTDESLAIARTISIRAPKVRVESLAQNSGAATARNHALSLARGHHVAFLDADDVAMPDRLATQLTAIENSASPALVCSATNCGSFRQPIDEIAPTLLFSNVITASTVLTRRDSFPGFRSGYEPAEDYDAWLRCVPAMSVQYLPRPLVHYRTHAGGVSARQAERMKVSRFRIVGEAIARLGVEASDDELAFHLSIADGTFPPTPATLDRAERWLLRLRGANRLFPPAPFARVLSRYWSSVCNGCWQAAGEAARHLFRSPLAPSWRVGFGLWLRLNLRAIAR